MLIFLYDHPHIINTVEHSNDVLFAVAKTIYSLPQCASWDLLKTTLTLRRKYYITFPLFYIYGNLKI
jgi:hypothetical protein